MVYLPALIAFAVSILTVPLSIWIARRFDTLDRADARKVHTSPTPRLGGIAIIAGLMCGVFGTFVYRQISGATFSTGFDRQLFAICGAGLFIFIVGLIDDIRSVSSRFKLIALCGAAATVCGSGIALGDIVLAGHTVFAFHSVSWLVTILWIVGVAVAINFIDGLDGLAGGLTLMSAAIVSFFLVTSGLASDAVLPLALCGGIAGFLFFNWHPARTFMGDCGSLSIGFFLASSMAMANPAVGTMRGLVLPSLAISIPILDAFLTMFRRRYLQRRSMFSAERGHIHHRLLDRGLSHPQAVIAIHLVSIMAVGIGFVALSFNGMATFGGLTLLIPLFWGALQLAGSVRTTEMVHALRTKREIDRTSKRHRATFEDMQLEFHHVKNFSQWWEGVCRAGDRLDFVHVTLRMPVSINDASEPKGNDREMNWATENSELAMLEQMKASLPVAISDLEGAAASLTVQIAATKSMESAGERLALFARLMTENSIAKVRKIEQNVSLLKRKHRRGGQVKSSLSADWMHDFETGLLPSDGQFGHLRVAIVHDFLYTYCGAERVVEQLINVFPHCDLFSLFDFLPDSQRGFLQGKSVTTSFIQGLPFARKKHRNYLPLMPLAIEQLDVSDYDLVISSSYLAAKGIITGPDQLHISYCHSPVRYAWDLHHHYLDEAGLGFGPKGLLARTILHYIRSWDIRSSMGVDQFIANSKFVARRIKKVYRRGASVVYPPVDTKLFTLNEGSRDDFYLVAGRMVPYKRTDLIVRAFQDMPDRKLVVIGEGPDFIKAQELAGPNVTFLGFQEADVLVDYMQRAKALIFAAEEDFGIVPVEALSCGTPVIAFGRGGVTETVIDGEHGVLFDRQTLESLTDAIERFESQRDFGKFSPHACRQRSLMFANEEFVVSITDAVKRWTSQKWPERAAYKPLDNESSFKHHSVDYREKTTPAPHS